MLPRVTFRGLPPSAEIMDIVTRKADKLSQVAPELRSCHVVIQASQRGGGHRPGTFRVLVHLEGGTDATRRGARHAESANLHGALGEVFRAVHRQLALHHSPRRMARPIGLPQLARGEDAGAG